MIIEIINKIDEKDLEKLVQNGFVSPKTILYKEIYNKYRAYCEVLGMDKKLAVKRMKQNLRVELWTIYKAIREMECE